MSLTQPPNEEFAAPDLSPVGANETQSCNSDWNWSNAQSCAPVPMWNLSDARSKCECSGDQRRDARNSQPAIDDAVYAECVQDGQDVRWPSSSVQALSQWYLCVVGTKVGRLVCTSPFPLG